jgi:hypothetical protein
MLTCSRHSQNRQGLVANEIPLKNTFERMHFKDRFGTLFEWARVLTQGGRLMFTDSAVITGAVAKSELDIRETTGFFLLVPPGLPRELSEVFLATGDDLRGAIALGRF